MSSASTEKRKPMWGIDPSVNVPYPGARPLRGAEEANLLRGREEFAKNLIDDVAEKRVVELTAESGVGKSSLLDARVVPALRDAGALVVMIRTWGNLAVETERGDDSALYAAALRQALDDGAEPGIDGVEGMNGIELIDELDTRFGAGLVIIFDQLEELFRDNSTIGRRFVAAVAEQANTREFHHIVSLRSEYKVGLEVIERRVPPELWRWHPLPPIGDSVVPEVITEPPLTSPETPHFTYEREAVEAISLWWTTARDYAWQVGLLHLQAFLWVLWQRSRPREGAVLTLETITHHWPAVPSVVDPDREQCVDLFVGALNDYVEGRLGGVEQSRTQSERERLFAMARVAPHLSSAGYKLVREVRELAALSIEGFDDLRLPPTFLDRAVGAAQQLGGSGTSGFLTGDAILAAVAAASDTTVDSLREKGDWSIPGGRMRGASPADTACEMVTAFESALRELTAESIVRTAPSADGMVRVSMVHDGFGPALDAWSDKVKADPMMTIDAMTTITARQLFWTNEGATDDGAPEGPPRFGPPTVAGANGITSIDNVGWVSCYVTAEFENVAFTNSNMSSTLFRKCKFTNVTFTDCQMWGTLFQECEFAGPNGVMISGPASVIIDGVEVDGMKSLTFDRCDLSGGGVTVDGVKGYGLIFDNCDGGPWKVVRSDLMHAMFDIAATRPEEAGSIEDCERILYFSSSERTSESPTIKNSTGVDYYNVGAWQVNP